MMESSPTGGEIPLRALAAPPVAPGRPLSRWWSLVSRKPRWGLTWRGWLFALLALTGIAVLLLLRIHPFLAVTQTVDSPVMVIEGWISGPALRAAAEYERSTGPHILYSTGGPLPDGEANGASNYAEVAGHELAELGLSKDGVQLVPCPATARDRTYTSAVALREWFKKHDKKVTALNVVTEGVHARRTRLMYEAAFGDGIAIGIISIKVNGYDPDRWWRYSVGVKEVISETAGYIFAKFLFHPEN